VASVALSAAEIADLLAVGPPVQCDPWVRPINSYIERGEEAAYGGSIVTAKRGQQDARRDRRS
jgi:hypothetical protein